MSQQDAVVAVVDKSVSLNSELISNSVASKAPHTPSLLQLHASQWKTICRYSPFMCLKDMRLYSRFPLILCPFFVFPDRAGTHNAHPQYVSLLSCWEYDTKIYNSNYTYGSPQLWFLSKTEMFEPEEVLMWAVIRCH